MSKRVEISIRLLRKLNSFYSDKRCILTKSTMNVDWHHLDEEHTNTFFENLVPLCRDYNNLLEQYRRIEKSKYYDWRGYDPSFSPESIVYISIHHYMHGDVSLSYGCARLASWMVRLYPSVFKKEKNHLAYSIEAIKSARHSGEQVLITDIVNRDFIPYVDKFDTTEKLQLLEESASIFQEYGDYINAREIFGILNTKHSMLNRNDMLIDQTRLLRRSAILHLQEYDKLLDALAMLKMAREYHYLSDTNRLVGIINSIAWTYMSLNQINKAIESLEEVLQVAFKNDGLPNPLVVGPWNAFETILTYYNALEIKEKANNKKVKNIEEQLRYMAELSTVSSLKLRPIAFQMSSSFKGETNPNVIRLYNELVSSTPEKMEKNLSNALVELVKFIISGL